MTAPFPMIEKALRELISVKMPEATTDRIGGDLSYTVDDEFYIFLGLVGGSTSEVDGEWSLDIDVFDNHYTQAMERALALEAILLRRGGHRTSLMILDNVYQNEVPISRPWDDENAFRVGATYTFTARRVSFSPSPVIETPDAGVAFFEGDGPPPIDLAAGDGDRYLDKLSGDLYTME